MRKIIILICLTSVFLPDCFAFQTSGEPTALILSGGGARGAYQIGVWKALLDLEVEIGAVYGVSVGAVNGAAVAAGEYERVKALWLGISKADVVNISRAGENVLSGNYSLQDLVTAAGEIFYGKGLDYSPLRRKLEDTVNEEAIRSGGIDYGLLAFSLSDLRIKYVYIDDIPAGELIDYILASANFPLFQRQVIDGKVYIDGGIYKNIPIEMVDPEKIRQAVIVALDTYAPFDIVDLITEYQNYGLDVKIISPSGDVGLMLDFDPGNAERLMKMGYLDGLRAFDVICGTEYFISCSEDVIRRMFLSLTPAEAADAISILEVGFTAGDADELYSNVIVPELYAGAGRSAGVRGDSKSAGTPADIIEILAKKAGVDHLQLYTSAGLASAAVGKYIARDNFEVYYDRYLDFISYLWLKSQYRIEFQMEPEGIFKTGLDSFNTEQE